jgi:hypothetical protein
MTSILKFKKHNKYTMVKVTRKTMMTIIGIHCGAMLVWVLLI